MATTPSIAMIPSGYKDEKVYSVLPTNGDGDFTFARTSTATRVNNNGLIEEVASNVPRLDYSEVLQVVLFLQVQIALLMLLNWLRIIVMDCIEWHLLLLQ